MTTVMPNNKKCQQKQIYQNRNAYTPLREYFKADVASKLTTHLEQFVVLHVTQLPCGYYTILIIDSNECAASSTKQASKYFILKSINILVDSLDWTIRSLLVINYNKQTGCRQVL